MRMMMGTGRATAPLAAAGLALAMATLAAAPAAAQVVYDFELNGSLANNGNGTGTLVNNGATLGPNGLTFPANGGPTLTGATPLTAYTLDLLFRFDNTQGYRKIADFFGPGTDYGLYNLTTRLNYYPFVTGAAGAIQPDVLTRVTFSRDAAGIAIGYVNGVQQITFDDSVSRSAVFGSTVAFFQDDFGGGEASAGFVDYIRVFGQALTPDQAVLPSGPSAVPEPAGWTLMILGFGGLGMALRRRRVVPALA